MFVLIKFGRFVHLGSVFQQPANAAMLALVTATKNSMRTIRYALESAASFRHKVKHYLIDAASSDGTREYLESFVTMTGSSVLLSQTGTGLYPALNQAVTAALADPEVTHIGFLHSDDRLISTQFTKSRSSPHVQRWPSFGTFINLPSRREVFSTP